MHVSFTNDGIAKQFCNAVPAVDQEELPAHDHAVNAKAASAKAEDEINPKRKGKLHAAAADHHSKAAQAFRKAGVHRLADWHEEKSKYHAGKAGE
jgi:hypothetical protein